jgi:serine/threonine-protein kinase
MFLIVEGEVQVPILDDDGRQRFRARLGPKQIFGEMALLTGEPRLADVIAVEPCLCLGFAQPTVDRLMHDKPEVARLLTAILGERLVSTGGIRQVGKYKLAGQVGEGRMSRVYEAVHPTLDRPVAIKMLSHELVYQPHFTERFRNEARIVAGLRHPNIVQVYDTEEAYATFFIVMERLPGATLQQHLEERGRLPFDMVRRVLAQLAAALHAAHLRGIVHRDVKPSNVMIGPEGGVKLMDFGLAYTPEEANQDGEPQTVGLGTPAYMPPEQIEGGAIDARSDVYALGIVAYEMLTGRAPFQGNLYHVLHQQLHTAVPALAESVHDVPADLAAFVARATRKAPGDRFADCEDVLDALGAPAATGSLANLGVRTLTLLFDPSQAAAADDLIDETLRKAAAIPGIAARR